MQPYIGITGFTKPDEVQAALAAWPSTSPQKLMIGVLASDRTLAGQRLKAPWRWRYPRIEDIKPLFVQDPRVLNLVHYHSEAKHKSLLYDELRRVMEFAGPNLHGFQLNIAWPDWSVMDILHTMYRLTFVLQIGVNALEQAHHQPQEIRDRVKPYLRAIDYVLIDASGGQGLPLKADVVRPILRELETLEVSLVVGGALGPNTLHLVEPLVHEIPNLSLDAESALRIPRGGLDLGAVRVYQRQALDLLAKHR